VILAGAVTFAMSGIVVAVGAHVTDFFAVSLSVMSFQSVPPHCGPGAATRAAAGSAVVAATAAAAAAATRTKRISDLRGLVRNDRS
jgi:Zn-dependent alcohol dehydrogenase